MNRPWWFPESFEEWQPIAGGNSHRFVIGALWGPMHEHPEWLRSRLVHVFIGRREFVLRFLWRAKR